MKKKSGPDLNIQEVVKKQKKLFIDIQIELMLKAILPYMDSKAKLKDVRKALKAKFVRLFENSKIYSVNINKKNSV